MMMNQSQHTVIINRHASVPPPIKVLHLLSSRGLYGAERVLLNLFDHYDKKLVNPYMALLLDNKAPANDLIETAAKRGAHNIIIPCGKWVDIQALKQVHAAIKKEGIHIIHCNEMKSRLYGLILAKKMHLPLITTHHNWIRNKLSTTIFEYMDAVYIRFADRIIPVSIGVKKNLRKIAVPEKRMTLILNGVNVKEFAKNEQKAAELRQHLNIDASDYIVGSVGRLSIEKGHRYFVEAAQRVLNKIPNIKFILIGEGELTDELRQYTQAMGIKRSVIFAGFQKDVAAFYSLMDICIMPSLLEGTPMALMEAMAAGLPVIASAVGGMPSIIEHMKNGILVEPADSDAIASAIITLIKDREAHKQIFENARKTIQERYSAARMARQYENEYQNLLYSVKKV